MSFIDQIITHLDGLLNPRPCGPGQHWTFIPEAGIYACTMKET